MNNQLTTNLNLKQKEYLLSCFEDLRNKIYHNYSIYKHKFFSFNFLVKEYNKTFNYNYNNLKTFKNNYDVIKNSKENVSKFTIENKFIQTELAKFINKALNALLKKDLKLNDYRILDAFAFACKILPDKYSESRIRKIEEKIRECINTFCNEDSKKYLYIKTGLSQE